MVLLIQQHGLMSPSIVSFLDGRRVDMSFHYILLLACARVTH